MSYVWFFMISLYLCSHFEVEAKVSQDKDNFEENDYKKLFEYKIPADVSKININNSKEESK